MLNIAVSLFAIAAAIMEVVDVLSTYRMLERGGHEANPIVVWFMQVLGDAWPLCKFPEFAIIIILWALAPKPIALICLGFMITVYGFAIWQNYQI